MPTPSWAVDWDRLRRLRQERARAACAGLGVCAFVATRRDNVAYVGGSPLPEVDGYEPSVAILTREGGFESLDPTLFIVPGPHGNDGGEWLERTTGWRHFSLVQPSVIADRYGRWIAEALARLGVTRGRVGIDGAPAPVHAAITAAAPEVELVDAAEALLMARAVKNDEELVLLRRAAFIASRGVEAALGDLKPGSSLMLARARAMETMYSLGSESDAFTPELGIGRVGSPAASLAAKDLHPVSRELEEGDPVIADFGPRLAGYNGDCMRTGFVGEPTDAFVELYRTIHAAVAAGIGATRPGIKCSAVDAAVRKEISARGFADGRFDTGHGIGLVSAEFPVCAKAGTLDDRLDLVLEPGMCFTIEPRLHGADGTQGDYLHVALEETVLVTVDGSEILTSAEFLDDLLEPAAG